MTHSPKGNASVAATTKASSESKNIISIDSIANSITGKLESQNIEVIA